jgi:hypothetical protein
MTETGSQRVFRYRGNVRRQALLWLIISGIVLAGLIGVLVTNWSTLTLLARVLGIILGFTLVTTARAQWSRIAFRCAILPDRLELRTPFGTRAIPWEEIVEVRRIRLPKPGRTARWACAVLTRGRTGNAIPTYAFDDQLEGASEALQAVVEATPHATHTNI